MQMMRAPFGRFARPSRRIGWQRFYLNGSIRRCDAPLGDEQRARNTAKSRVRARVEHVFGQMENGMGGMFLRSIGLARAKVGAALMNLAYNLRRVEWLIRSKVFPFTRVTAPVRGAA